MKIHKIRTIINGNEKTVSGLIDDFELWYRLPVSFGSDDFADPFLAAALPVAMIKGENIVMEDERPVSYKLLQGICRLQDIYSAWYSFLNKVEIKANVVSHHEKVSQPGLASFFSGGVDSLYTFYSRQNDITHLIFLGGIDMQLSNQALYSEVLQRNTEFSQRHNKKLVPLVTNLRQFCHPNSLSWGSHYSGAGLSSIALLLGFPYTLIPSSQAYTSLYPEGTSPVLDHLYSNEATTIYYDGGLTRPEKIAYLGQYPESLEIMRVCWQDNGYNCGRCEKCLRTMLILKILDLRASTLPQMSDITMMKNWRIESDAQKMIFVNLVRAAKKSNHQDIYRYLLKIQRRESLKRWLATKDRELFSGAMKNLLFKFKSAKT